ncbi:MAG: DUF2934 domain-containing protein [Bryobacterales bacterium]|nr:DUF2934 domain-containing protein [Bryobacterales bacterium]
MKNVIVSRGGRGPEQGRGRGIKTCREENVLGMWYPNVSSSFCIMPKKSSKSVTAAVEPKPVAAAPVKEKKPRARKVAAPAPVAQSYETLQQEIAKLAYFFWMERGQEHGNAVEDWLRAEREVMNKLAMPSERRQ